jgi:hypothetical protein
MYLLILIVDFMVSRHLFELIEMKRRDQSHLANAFSGHYVLKASIVPICRPIGSYLKLHIWF